MSSTPAFKINIDLENDLSPPLHDAQRIGGGAFATIFKSTYEGMNVAVKYFQNQHTPLDDTGYDFRKELSIIQHLNHRHIVKFYGASLTPGKRAIIMELVDRDLNTLIKNQQAKNARNNTNEHFEISDIFKIVKGIASGLDYLHSNRQQVIVHRDLHPANVLISRGGEVKVTDYGISKTLNHTVSQDSNRGGCFAYLPPEILFTERINRRSDIFSLGVIAWQIWTLKQPWQGLREGLICTNIQNGNRPIIPDDMPTNLRNLITRCWAQNFTQRPTAKEVVQMCQRELEEIRKASQHR